MRLAGFRKAEAESGQFGRDRRYFCVHQALGAEARADGGFVELVSGTFAVDEPDGD